MDGTKQTNKLFPSNPEKISRRSKLSSSRKTGKPLNSDTL